MMFTCCSDADDEFIPQPETFSDRFRAVFEEGYWMEKGFYDVVSDSDSIWYFSYDIKGVPNQNPHTFTRFYVNNEEELTETIWGFDPKIGFTLSPSSPIKYHVYDDGRLVINPPIGTLTFNIKSFCQDTIIAKGCSWYVQQYHYLPYLEESYWKEDFVDPHTVFIRVKHSEVFDE